MEAISDGISSSEVVKSSMTLIKVECYEKPWLGSCRQVAFDVIVDLQRDNRDKGSLNDNRKRKLLCERWIHSNKSLGSKEEILTAKYFIERNMIVDLKVIIEKEEKI
eukprot:15339745-Ditylum_brightwellii.AAC.1